MNLNYLIMSSIFFYLIENFKKNLFSMHPNFFINYFLFYFINNTSLEFYLLFLMDILNYLMLTKIKIVNLMSYFIYYYI